MTLIKGQQDRSINIEVSNSADIGAVLAKKVLARFFDSDPLKPFILGSPTGSTPKPFFSAFIDLATALDTEQRNALHQRLRIVIMDDFVDLQRDENIPLNDPNSAVRFMNDHFLDPLASAIETPAFAGTVLFPEVGKVGALRDAIIAQGGVNLQILATDPFDAHVGQNFPGEPFEKLESAKTAPLSAGFTKHHPWSAQYRGVTFDLKDFCDMVAAHPLGRFDLVITGEAKRNTLERFLKAGHYDPEIPLSFLWLESEITTVYTDLAL